MAAQGVLALLLTVPAVTTVTTGVAKSTRTDVFKIASFKYQNLLQEMLYLPLHLYFHLYLHLRHLADTFSRYMQWSIMNTIYLRNIVE